jgi:hypothetical protein
VRCGCGHSATPADGMKGGGRFVASACGGGAVAASTDLDAYAALQPHDRVDHVHRERVHVEGLRHVVQACLGRLDDGRQVAVGELAQARDAAAVLQVLRHVHIGDGVLHRRAGKGDGERHRREEMRHESLEAAAALDVLLRLVRRRVDVLGGERREEQQRGLVDVRLGTPHQLADDGHKAFVAKLGTKLPLLFSLELVGQLVELREAGDQLLLGVAPQQRRKGKRGVAGRHRTGHGAPLCALVPADDEGETRTVSSCPCAAFLGDVLHVNGGCVFVRAAVFHSVLMPFLGDATSCQRLACGSPFKATS